MAMNPQKQASEQRATSGSSWKEWAGLLAFISISSLSRYYGWESVAGFLLLLVAFLLFLLLLALSLRFLWLRFLQRRWVTLSAWWVCKRRQCDYYQIYQAYGTPDLTHVGYHAGERLAIEHFLIHSESSGSSKGCEVCRNWAERLRGGFWVTLMAQEMAQDDPSSPADLDRTDEILRTKKRQFGFLGGTHETPGKMD
jgi:hypothetical protein